MNFARAAGYVFPVSYGLLAVVAITIAIGYGLSEVAPVYVAAAIYAIGLLAFVLPASALLINIRQNIGGVVGALVLTLSVTPVVLAVGGTLTTARAALSVFEDIGNDFDTEFGGEGDTEGDLGGDPSDLLQGPADYSGATTSDECEEIWLTDYSSQADEARDACLERVG